MRRKFNMSIYKSKHNVGDVEFVECPYCEKSETNRFKMLHHKHLAGHNKTLEDVLKEFPGLITMTLAEKNKKIKSEQKHQEELIKLAHRLQGVNLEFNEKVDNKGQLFGGISSAHIVSALAQKGLKVEKNQIILERAYKQIGKYLVKIKLAQGAEAEIKIIINKK